LKNSDGADLEFTEASGTTSSNAAGKGITDPPEGSGIDHGGRTDDALP